MNRIGDKVKGFFFVQDEDVKDEEVLAPPPPPPRAHTDEAVLGRVMSLLASLPADATIDVQRAIVGASLQAFGVPTARVLAEAEQALGAIEAELRAGEARAHEETSRASERITELEAAIAAERRKLAVANEAQATRVRAAQTDMMRIRGAIEFFGGPSKKSLRLVG